jgi:hypothetical protein
MGTPNRHVVAEDELDTLVIFDHFANDQVDTIGGVDTVTDSGTVAMGDAAGGQIVLTPSDGTVADNDEAYYATPNEVFLFATGKNLYGRCRFKFAEVAAGVANVAFGFMNAVGANAIIDDGAGLKVSGSTAGVYKVDGEQVFRVVTANNSASTVTKTNRAAVAATWYDVEIFGTDNGDGTWVFTFKVDGEYLRDANNAIIRHAVTIASATEMQMFLGVKLGAATNNDTLTADLWLGKQKVF